MNIYKKALQKHNRNTNKDLEKRKRKLESNQFH